MMDRPTVTKRISYQGWPGANSDMACRGAYPDYEPLPCPSFEDTIAAVHAGDADLAMIPIENSIAGRVADIHHLLPESNLYIIREWFQPVHHQLLGKPGTTLADLKAVHSHTQALGQCRKRLRDWGLEPITSADTAGAAKWVSEQEDRTQGAIASTLAAETYGLAVLQENIEDDASNVTRFVVMAREPDWPRPGEAECLTSLVFEVRSVPAALYKALGGFATNKVNITKLESYMVDNSFSQTQFYMDVEGHPYDPALRHAFEELGFFARKDTVQVLGVYPKADYRPGEE